ncbi:microviridin/marinostatin family tricyclic proteinase inhibitor [Scytonema hofmannii FACHB-248]|uniref:Microviridin/marinostatin family tricyclic proteinase inhibitor n=1 Tax=Scytonema hofmannii FACHB-248 TaxID=1842502 RepID=A0ABR8GQU3_9CYAN|nr:MULTISPECIES: microviridin/marinostatin family tricyclic proteinase inhibitor [Nostocales]MBD2605820.1 microviridin/marinostatin family tricyclic proteinase inhibitor [Scytonema hofmannii FACHB-248]
MSDNHKPDFNSSKVPFFARYLEGQFCEDLSSEEMEAVEGGITFVTLKYPSDNEEGGHGGGIVTNKFRDKYDWGGGIVTKKYPSDADEYAVTQKYPSDGDDHAFPIE